jgi:hypothetical protein
MAPPNRSILDAASSGAERGRDVGVFRSGVRLGQPIAASAPGAGPSMGNSDGAPPRSGGATQSSSTLRDRTTRPLPSRLKLERNDGDRVSGASGEHNLRRLGSQRGLTALVGEAPFQSGAFRRLDGACKPHGNFKALASSNSCTRRLRNDEPWLSKVGQPLGERAQLVLNVHEAVRFPLHVIEFGDDVTGNRPLPAQRLDLALEPAILKLLRCAHEAIKIAEDWRKLRVAKARLEPVRVSGAEVPVVAAFEPPRLASVRLQDLARMRQISVLRW